MPCRAFRLLYTDLHTEGGKRGAGLTGQQGMREHVLVTCLHIFKGAQCKCL